MQRRRLLCIGPLPPVTHGQSEAFDVLIRSGEFNASFDISIVNLNFVNKPLIEKLAALVLQYLKFRLAFVSRRPDVVYISFGRGKRSFQRDYLFLRAILKKNIPVIAHCHGGDMPLLLDLLKRENLTGVMEAVERTFWSVKRVIVLSASLAEDFQGLVKRENLRVVPNCFRLPLGFALPSPGAASRKEGDGLEILFLSNVNPEKGFFEALESIGILKSRGYNVRLTFVGTFINDADHSAKDLKRMTAAFLEKHGIGDRVKIMGPRYGCEKWNEYLKADIFVLPTYYKTEGSPVSIMEAMAAGCAIIATRYRGIVDLVEEGVDGLFVGPRNAEELADKIEVLYKDPLKLAAMKTSAHKKALSAFTEDKYVTGIIDIINEVVEQREAGK